MQTWPDDLFGETAASAEMDYVQSSIAPPDEPQDEEPPPAELVAADTTLEQQIDPPPTPPQQEQQQQEQEQQQLQQQEQFEEEAQVAEVVPTPEQSENPAMEVKEASQEPPPQAAATMSMAMKVDDDSPPPASAPAPAPAPAPTPTPALAPPAAPPALSELETLQAHLAQKRYDPAAWHRLIDLAEESPGDLSQVKDAYESLLKAYPNTAEAQIAYIDHYMQAGLFPTAEALFNRFLRPSPSVQLWKFYLSYVRRMNSDPSTRDMVSKAYDFALMYIGHDKDSGEIWREYIDFVNSGETHNNTWEEQQKMDALRRIYQRAVQIPLENLEQLWSEYNSFEVKLNKITARKFIQDLGEAYSTAKNVLKELRLHLAILFPPLPGQNISSSGRKFYLPEPMPPSHDNQRSLAKSWRTYLQWEEKNPLDIEDKNAYNARVLGTYKKAVIRMRFNPETWYMAYSWTEKNGKPEEAVGFLKSGLESNPSSFTLNFAYSEALENSKNYQEVHTLFGSFIEALQAEVEKVAQTIPAQPPPLPQQQQQQQQHQQQHQPQQQPLSTSNGTLLVSSSQFSTSSILTPERELSIRKRELAIAWIAYMRFARRAEGLKAARAVFSKARKDKSVSWEVYEAAASMEYHFSKATEVATRIYETGMKQFGEDSEYVLRYLKFLISVNDETNARALFERVIGTFVPEKARPLWETWTSYEFNYGDLSAAVKLEKRMAEVYPDDNSMRRLAQRHKYSNHDAIAVRDLGWLPPGSGGSTSSNGSTRNESSGNLGIMTTLGSGSTSNAPYAGLAQKRPVSPERGRIPGRSESQEGLPPPPKRAREVSPPLRDRERDRRDRDRREPPPPPRRRHSPPDWGRGSSPPRRGEPPHARADWGERDAPVHEERPPFPSLVGFFVSQLPLQGSFDGPIFRVDDLMQVFRNATIPGQGGGGGPPPRVRSPPPPPPPAARGRPPPDYSPYQGPSSGPARGRRY